MIRADNLLEIQNGEVPLATVLDKGLQIYLSQPSQSQVWIADINYIRPKRRILLFGGGPRRLLRKVVGWSPDRTDRVHESPFDADPVIDSHYLRTLHPM
jgi:hypothetical protein